MKRVLFVGLAAAALLAIGCTPESTRARSGGPGADIGNWGRPPDIHGPVNPSYGTPARGLAIQK